MGYLADALKHLSSDKEFIFVGTGVIVINEYNQILMGKRTDNNEWCIPGGSLELHESIEECAVRELWEETKIKTNADKLKLNAVKFIDKPINKNGRDIYVVSVSYVVREYDDIELSLDSREFSKYGWFTEEEIQSIFDVITPYTQAGLAEFFKQERNKGNGFKN